MWTPDLPVATNYRKLTSLPLCQNTNYTFIHIKIYRPLPIAMVWSPSDSRLVKREGSHCIICSEANPRMAQLVRMEAKTMAFMTDSHTPMSFTLN